MEKQYTFWDKGAFVTVYADLILRSQTVVRSFSGPNVISDDILLLDFLDFRL